jgi:hypothetical protein
LSNIICYSRQNARKGNGWWEMNIKQYYRRHAFVQFAVACVCILGIVLLIGMGVKRKWEIFIPLVVFSLFFFSASWLNFRRAAEVKIEKRGEVKGISSLHDYILLQLPAADAHILFFEPSGLLVAELRSRRNYPFAWLYPRFLKEMWRKQWTLYSQSGEVLAHYRRSFGRYATLYVYNKDNQLIGAYLEAKSAHLARIEGTLLNASEEKVATFNVEDNLYQYKIIGVDGKQLVSFSRGWVPLEWGKRFKEADTPVITMNSQLDECTRYIILGMAAYLMHRLYK